MFKSRLFHPVSDQRLCLTSAEDFARFYDAVHVDVFRYIYALVGRHRQEAEDLTTETFIRAWKARQRFNGSEDAAKGWVLVIARNIVIDHHRRERHHTSESPAQDWRQIPADSSNTTTEASHELAATIR